MKLDDGKTTKDSIMGATLTILLILMVGLFTITKVLTWFNRLDVDIMSALQENEIDFNFKFTTEEGFFLAAALTEYNSDREITEDKRYGELVIDHYGWGNSDGTEITV